MKLVFLFIFIINNINESHERIKLDFIDRFINNPDSLEYYLEYADFNGVYFLNRIKKHDRTIKYYKNLAVNFMIKDSNYVWFEVVNSCEYDVQLANGKSIHYGITIINKSGDFGLNFDWKLHDNNVWVLHEITRVKENCLNNYKESKKE